MGIFEEKFTRKIHVTFLLYACLKVSQPKSKKNRWIEWKIFQKLKRKNHMKKLSFITQFKIEFLLPFTGCRKCLEKCLLVNYLMLLWERINGKPIIFDKPIIFLYWLAGQHQHPQTRTFWRKNRTQFTLDLGQNWMSLLAASKNNWKWLKNCYD